jgi:hypothetical protein
MLRQARHFSDPSRQCRVVELIDHRAEPLSPGISGCAAPIRKLEAGDQI